MSLRRAISRARWALRLCRAINRISLAAGLALLPSKSDSGEILPQRFLYRATCPDQGGKLRALALTSPTRPLRGFVRH
jgi:hypothetical protein